MRNHRRTLAVTTFAKLRAGAFAVMALILGAGLLTIPASHAQSAKSYAAQQTSPTNQLGARAKNQRSHHQRAHVRSPASAPDQRLASLAFIRNSVMPSGALASHTDRTFINPYLANLATRGLASSCVAADRTALYGHLSWYASHGLAGVVSDHNLIDGVEVSAGDQDSQDAYSGTFLSGYASAAASANASETARLADLRPAVAAAIDRIVTLQDGDGMTWAKPGWKVKYLMDQIEVYWGLSEVLPFIKNDAPLWVKASTSRARLITGIKSLWQPTAATFAFAKHENGVVVASDPSRAYPDAVSQLWAVASDITTSSQSKSIMKRIDSTITGMSNPLAVWTVDQTKQEPTGYWPLISTAYRRIGKLATANAYDVAMLQARSSSGNSWPYDVATAGYLLAPRDLPLRQPSRCG